MDRLKVIGSVAFAIGAIISAALMAAERVTDYALLGWEGPGIAAAYLFWGAAGSSPALGMAIAWLVNTLVYGAAAFVVLAALRLLLPRKLFR
jgi:hypothetical protein